MILTSFQVYKNIIIHYVGKKEIENYIKEVLPKIYIVTLKTVFGVREQK